jgi:hypothetical protein
LYSGLARDELTSGGVVSEEIENASHADVARNWYSE